MTGARLTIDLDALARNQATLRATASGAEVAPVVKADAYGLGVGPVARRLRAEGARRFFVARLSEGEALRAELGQEATIYVLDGADGASLERLTQARLTPVLNSAAQAAAWAPTGLPAVLHFDTGMHRLGATLAETAALAATPPEGLRIELVMSHLGSATTPGHARTPLQLTRFVEARALFPGALASLSASAGVFLGSDYAFDVVRPGISLYGGGPLERPEPRLDAVVTMTAPVLELREVTAGEWIGYGERVRATRPMRLALVGAGYADGVIRGSGGAGFGVLHGRRLPFVIVTMDLIALEIGELSARIGDTVELLGAEAQLDDLASAAGTVAHEVLVRLSARAERVYRGA